jgi:hypothetical protein
MRGSLSDPIPAIRVTTYTELNPWLAGFRGRKFDLLFLTGAPGLGKSRAVRGALEGCPHLWIEGHATPLSAYVELYRHRDRPVVIDDEDTFHADPQKVALMKSLCGTEPVKRLAWGTTSPVLAEAGVPSSFETTSKVVVVTNRATAVRPCVAALFDRAHVLAFEPSAAEVHARVAPWLGDPEVLAFFAEWLPMISAPSMRRYVLAKQMKAAGLDWKAVLLEQWEATRYGLVARLHADPELATEEQRAAAFEARGGGSRATYFRYLKKWRALHEPPA